MNNDNSIATERERENNKKNTKIKATTIISSYSKNIKLIKYNHANILSDR